MNKDVAYALSTERGYKIQGFFFSPWPVGCPVRGGDVGGAVFDAPERRRNIY